MLRSQGRRCRGRRVVVTGEGHVEVTGEEVQGKACCGHRGGAC